MTQKQNIINQIEAHWFLQKSIFQNFSFHIQIRITIKYDAYYLITNEY